MALFTWLSESILSPAATVALLVFGSYFGAKTRAFYLFHPVAVFRLLRNRKEKEGTSGGKALALALAGTLGVGNLVGVSAAIAIGGAGAVFWMWISTIASMVLKYGEVVLALRHRRKDVSGRGMGGCTMHYMEDLGSGCKGKVGRASAILFALLCLLCAVGMGCFLQVNAIAAIPCK